MPGIGVIVNPHASGNRNLPRRLERMRATLGADGEAVATDALDDLDPVLLRFRERGVDLVGVCGGDGSLYHVLTRLVAVWGGRTLPAILPLRAGTMNDLAATVGSRVRCPDRALERVVQARRTGGALRQIERNLIRVNGSGYGYVVGAGLIVKFLELYYRGWRPGPLRAHWLLVRVGCSWLIGTSLVDEICGPIGATVEADGRLLTTERFTLLLAGSIAHIGLGLRPFYLSENPGYGIHLLAGNCSPGELLSRLWRFYRGRPAVLASLEDSAARRVRIQFDQARPYTINGELFDPVRELDLETGPRVRFVGC